jgi:hypothetical protein
MTTWVIRTANTLVAATATTPAATWGSVPAVATTPSTKGLRLCATLLLSGTTTATAKARMTLGLPLRGRWRRLRRLGSTIVEVRLTRLPVRRARLLGYLPLPLLLPILLLLPLRLRR